MVEDGDSAGDRDGGRAGDRDGGRSSDMRRHRDGGRAGTPAGGTDSDTEADSDGDWTIGLPELGGGEDRELRPGSPKLEHVVFVCLGVLATLIAIFRTLFG